MDIDIEDLRRWYEEYRAIDAEFVNKEHPLLQAVESDELDVHTEEARIRALMQRYRRSPEILRTLPDCFGQ